jgi:hypothetical protein
MRPVDGVADQTRAKSVLDFRQIPLFIEKGIQVKEMALSARNIEEKKYLKRLLIWRILGTLPKARQRNSSNLIR